jgi:multidrug efflux pump subunit AcrA (membrane-fusion protein)
MTRHPLVLVLVLVLVLATSARAEESASVEFKEGSGLKLPEETRKSLGLRIADVEDREIRPEWRVVLQVFRTGPDGVDASGLVDPAILARLREGQEISARHTVDNDPLSGRIEKIDPQSGAATGRGELIVRITGATSDLRTGSFLDAVVTDAAEREATAIPSSALLRTASGTFAYVVNGLYFLRTTVTPGATSGDWIEIVDGLYAGDQVVVEPAELLWLTELRAVKGGGHCH